MRHAGNRCSMFMYRSFSFDFRCYADELANKTILEIREIYSTYADPSCSVYKGNQTAVSNRLLGVSSHANDTNEKCQRWIYEKDYGYQSMSAEVCASH